jgi:aspartyl protease family protein
LAQVVRFTAMAILATASALITAQTVVRLNDGDSTALLATVTEARAGRGVADPPPLRSDAVPKASDGHYWAQGDVDGATVRFLVDTGATEVALTPADAQRLGIDVSKLNYGSNVVTATGRTRAAAVRLASVTVAGARLDDVDALVIEKGLDASLLGMSYLGRLSSFQATREGLFLRP